MTTHDDAVEDWEELDDEQDEEERPEGLRQWVVLDADGGFIAEGQAVGIRGWATMVAVMRLQPEHEKVYGLLLNCDTDHLARFDRIRPGCYQARA